MVQVATSRGAVGAPGGLRRVLADPRTGRIGAVGVGGVVLAMLVAAIPLSTEAHLTSSVGFAPYPLALSCLVVGTLLAARRPDNAMGWCLLAVALFFGLTTVGGSLSVLDYRMHRSLPFGGVGVVLQPGWAPNILFFGLSLLIFPHGRFSSRLVRWLSWLALAVGVVWAAGAYGIATQAVLTHAVHLDRTGNLLAIDDPRGSWAWWAPVQYAFFFVLGFSLVVWLVQQVPRYRRAGDEERHQMKWLLSGAVVALGCGLAGFAEGSGWVAAIGIAGLTVLPVSIAVGVTKFHLYAIDRLVSRTLSYLLVTGVVVGVYVGVVTLATKGIGSSSPVGVAASTLVAAALFNPLRKRFQHGVDRRFNRSGYDAQRTVSAFAARLRESVDPGEVGDDLLGVVQTVFEPSASSLWVRR